MASSISNPAIPESSIAMTGESAKSLHGISAPMNFTSAATYIISEPPRPTPTCKPASLSLGNALSGSNLSDFLLGTGANFSQDGGIYYNYGGIEGSLFAQDNWRVNQSLTINFGIRWDPYFTYTDQKNRMPLLPARIAIATLSQRADGLDLRG